MVKAAIIAYGQPLDENEPYTNGPDAKNSGYSCDGWVGSLDDAVIKCNADTSCRYLHNLKGDLKIWRFCSSVGFAYASAKQKLQRLRLSWQQRPWRKLVEKEAPPAAEHLDPMVCLAMTKLAR